MATCGARIEQYKREGLTDEEAKAKVGLFYAVCEPCWPWPKYKEATDNRISMKRGIAAHNSKLSSESLSVLAQNLYWGYVSRGRKTIMLFISMLSIYKLLQFPQFNICL